ncbi:BON domain-containing protein [Ottowia sp. VDI28]|uniref:BON domain-containing protein n=1 Tax=Ottowia sp. VDI28 TaxID=3133968 RepID=UPI003C2E749A
MSQHATSIVRTSLTACALATGAILAGCAGGGGWSEPGGSMSNSQAAKASYAQNLEQRVMAALRADPRVGAQGLRVEGRSDGTVIISGSPANGTAGRDLALMIARNVGGVRNVVNSMVMN